MSKKREYKKGESSSDKYSKEEKSRSGTDRQGSNSSRPGYFQPKDKRGTSRFRSGSESGYKKDDKSSFKKDARPERSERSASKPRFFQPKDGGGRPERNERPYTERKGSDFNRSEKGGYSRGKDDNSFRAGRGGKPFKNESPGERRSGSSAYGKRKDDGKAGSERSGRSYRNEGSDQERSGKPSYDKRRGDENFRSERSGKPYRNEGSDKERSGKPSYDKRKGDENFRSEKGGKPFRTEGSDKERSGKPSYDKGWESKTSSNRYDKKDSSFEKREKSFRNSRDDKQGYESSSERRRPAQRKDGDLKDKEDRKEFGRKKEFTERRPRSLKSNEENELKQTPTTSNKGEIRLNRYIANAGICSRRDADLLIQAGEITVNGKVVTEMGYKVNPGDEVRYNNRRLKREKPVYVLLNKPKDFITTTDDPENRKTIMQLVDGVGNERIYPVGRLDRNTTGLILLTNDGELADKLSHPSNNIKKLYQVDLDKPISPEDLFKIQEGVQLEDGLAEVDQVAIISSDNTSLGLQIHSGKNRIVRRIFEHLGYDVVKLDRVMYAGLDKKDLPRGKWRLLSEQEVIRLKYMK